MMKLEVFDPYRIWVTSDFHLSPEEGRCGESTISESERPFASCSDSNRHMVDEVCRLVPAEDALVILGDLVSLDVTDSNVEAIIAGVPKRHTWLVLGNHDANVSQSKWEDAFGSGHVGDYLEMTVAGMENDGHDGTPLRVLCLHYPMLEWAGDQFGNVHLHGHSHNRAAYNGAQRDVGRRVYDVGVDANGFRPVRLSDILGYMGLTGVPENPYPGEPFRVQ